MNPQKVGMTIKQGQKQLIEAEEHPWALENPEITLTKIENQNFSIAIYSDIQ